MVLKGVYRVCLCLKDSMHELNPNYTIRVLHTVVMFIDALRQLPARSPLQRTIGCDARIGSERVHRALPHVWKIVSRKVARQYSPL